MGSQEVPEEITEAPEGQEGPDTAVTELCFLIQSMQSTHFR